MGQKTSEDYRPIWMGLSYMANKVLQGELREYKRGGYAYLNALREKGITVPEEVYTVKYGAEQLLKLLGEEGTAC